jgi:hypothetical protein
MMGLKSFDAQRRALFRERQRGLTGPAHERAVRIVTNIMDMMRSALNSGLAQEAFTLGIGAKSFRLPVRDLDLLRAEIFSRLGRIPEAEQSLREELRHFPGNTHARQLLESLLRERTPPVIQHDECEELVRKVRGFTMLGEKRLRSLYHLAKSICVNDVPGDFMECGVAGGGSSVLLALVMQRYSKPERILYCLDTFEGMPDPGEMDQHNGIGADATGWGAGTCAAPEAAVQDLFESFGVSAITKTVKGLFQDSLPLLRKQLGFVAFLHLDGDWYDSTMSVLGNLSGMYSQGAILQIDDYGYWEGCSRAVHEYEEKYGVRFNIHTIDDTGVWCEAPGPR